jgi:nucleoside phosphorylase
LTLACATEPEERAGRRSGLRTSLIGLAGRNGLPPGRLVSFGLAGALRDGLAAGDVLDVVRVVDEGGAVLWEGDPLGVPDARPATILASGEVVDDPAERRRLHDATGADAVDLESGPLARSGRLAGGVRVVSDTPARTLHGICNAVTPAGEVDWAGVTKAFVRAPAGFARAVVDAKRAMRRLEEAAEALR